MEQIIVTEKEFEQRLAKFIEQQGPNPATSFFGSMAWNGMKREEFRRRLTSQGFRVVPIDYTALNKGNFTW